MNKLKLVAEGKLIGSPLFTEGEYHAAIFVVHEPKKFSGITSFADRDATSSAERILWNARSHHEFAKDVLMKFE